jgi:prepilin-type N-terminal cleavage/methylation domain-containing protein
MVMNLSKGRSKGFTLIELLVVMVIIGILAAMLMPALGRAREESRRGACKSNLKQIGLGVNMYAQDYNENFPQAANTLSAFTAMLQSGRSVSSGVFFCPSDQYSKKSERDLTFVQDCATACIACNPSCISYAYGHNMGPSSPVDWVVAVDKSGAYNTQWASTVYVDGHAEWIVSSDTTTLIPNSTVIVPTKEGYLLNP